MAQKGPTWDVNQVGGGAQRGRSAQHTQLRWACQHVPVVLEVVDDVANSRVGAVLEQSHLRALARSGEVALQSRRARVEHAVISASERERSAGRGARPLVRWRGCNKKPRILRTVLVGPLDHHARPASVSIKEHHCES